MLCLLVGLISRRCVMACAAAQTSPRLELRKVKILRKLSKFRHLLAIPGDGDIKGCKWPPLLISAMLEQCGVFQPMAEPPSASYSAASLHFCAQCSPCACELVCRIILGIFGKSSTLQRDYLPDLSSSTLFFFRGQFSAGKLGSCLALCFFSV